MEKAIDRLDCFTKEGALTQLEEYIDPCTTSKKQKGSECSRAFDDNKDNHYEWDEPPEVNDKRKKNDAPSAAPSAAPSTAPSADMSADMSASS